MDREDSVAKSIGFIGGTGPEGKGMAARFARAGLEVMIGSRAAERGQEAAEEVAGLSGKAVKGGTNAETATASEIIVVTVPYSGLKDTLVALQDELAGKTVISAVVPLQFSRGKISVLPVEEGSAAEQAQAALPRSTVTGAFHNLSASHLLDLEHPIDGDVIVCADNADALKETIELSELIEGVRGVNGGPLASSRYIEDLTALLLTINRIYKAETHVKIVGL